jgi:hypothetical protein
MLNDIRCERLLFLLTIKCDIVNYSKNFLGGLMKKGLICIVLITVFMCVVQLIYAQEKRIYNDGVIDYVPLSASFVLNAEDSESTLKEIQYSIDGSPVAIYENPISFTEEGRHFIAYRAIDKTGNISSEKIYSVIVDGTPPEGLASIEGTVHMEDEYVYLTDKSAIVLWATDNLSGVDQIYVKLDDMDYVPYMEPVMIQEEGFHTAQTFAVDNVGNVTPTFVVQGYVDNTPPEVSIDPKEDFVVVSDRLYTNKNNEFRVNVHDSASGVQLILVSFDGSEFVTYNENFKVQIPGFHTVRAKAIDNVGNESFPVEIGFFVDVVPPDTKLGASVD